MKKLYEFFAKRKLVENYRKDMSCLQNFMNSYHEHSLDQHESFRNLEDSLVELVWEGGSHRANGILISEHGYLLTARHCIEKSDITKARLRDGKTYFLERVCAHSKYDNTSKDEIALAKIEVPSLPHPKKYKINRNFDVQVNTPVCLMTLFNGRLNRRYGIIQANTNSHLLRRRDGCMQNLSDQFITNIAGNPGDSGGIIVNPEGELLGIHSNGHIDGCFGGEIRMARALKLVEFYSKALGKRIE